METRAALILIMLVTECVVSSVACGPGRGSGRPPRRRRMTPLVFKQHVPNVSENTLGASGPAEGAISHSDSSFDDLVVNNNPDIVFKNRRGTNNDRIMSQRCKEKLNMLSVLVMNQWPDVRLRVTEAWVDDDTALGAQSLHLEGRAVDVTTSDRDRSKYGMLARLAVDAGFDWVYFESRGHIHCSVKSDSSMAAGGGGCFPADATVTLETGQRKTMDNVTIGERVMTYDALTKQFHYDAVVTFLHHSRQTTSATRYLTLQTQHGHRLTLTPGHLIFAAQHAAGDLQPVFAGLLRPGSYVSVSASQTVEQTKVVRVIWSRDRAAGVYAPITERGTIVVDDVIVSCYAEFSSHVTAHVSIAPLRYVYYVRELTSRWLSQWMQVPHPSAVADDDEPHWYASILWRLAKVFVPTDFWWSPAAA